MKTRITRNVLTVISCWLLAIGFVGCGGGSKNANNVNRQACIDSIKAIEAKLKATMTPDPAIYNRAVSYYLRFSNNFPDDTMAPVCLFDAANISMSLNEYRRAISLYDSINTKYPTFKKAADCIFIRGFIYDDKLKDTAKAHAMYQMLIDKYPHDSLASQARAAISILGKSTEELIKEFEEKNKGNKKS